MNKMVSAEKAAGAAPTTRPAILKFAAQRAAEDAEIVREAVRLVNDPWADPSRQRQAEAFLAGQEA